MNRRSRLARNRFRPFTRRTKGSSPATRARRAGLRRLATETLEPRVLLAADLAAWQNAVLPADVNDDGAVSPLDALLVINELNRTGSRSLAGQSVARAAAPTYYDVNGDNFVSPLDALLVLNDLNAEGEDDDIVRIRLQPAHPDGTPINGIGLTEDFVLQTLVQDLTGREDGGVFTAGVDILYDPARVELTGEVTAADPYAFSRFPDTSEPGLIDEAGAFGFGPGFTELGPAERLFLSAPFSPLALASTTFDVQFGTEINEVAVFGDADPDDPALNSIVPPDRIDFVGANLALIDGSSPVADDEDYDTFEDSPLIIGITDGLLTGDSDPDGDDLTADALTQPENGTLSLEPDGSFTYSPDLDFHGTDTFTYTARDDTGLNSFAATVTIIVTAVNDAPVAEPDTYSVAPDGVLMKEAAEGVLANDSDIDGDDLTATQTGTGPANGELTLDSDGGFIYLPDPGFEGVDTFQYFASDAELDSNVATVTINVSLTGAAPVATGDDFDVDEDGVLNVAAPGVLDNDSDADGDPLTAIKTSDPAHGSLTFSADGSFSYTPDADYNGPDSFTYVANDGGRNSSEAIVAITVNSVNDAPVALNDDTFSVDEDDTLNIGMPGVLANDSDVDGDVLSAIVVTGPANGSLDLNPDGSFEYIPNTNFSGADTFRYVANDGLTDSNQATVTIIINAINDAPVANDNSYSVERNMPLTIGAPGVLGNDNDPDGDSLTAEVVDDPATGDLTFNPNGSFSYTPEVDFTGEITFTYIANDGAEDSDLATVTIDVLEEPLLVRIDLVPANLFGLPISKISAGAPFLLQGFVQDLRADADGVFAAYTDVSYSFDFVSINGLVTFGESYPNQQFSDTSVDGLIDEVGAFAGDVGDVDNPDFDPLGGDPVLLFSVPLTADEIGTAFFSSEEADVTPDHDVLLFGEAMAVPETQIEFGSALIVIEEGIAPVAEDDGYETDEDIPLVLDAAMGVLDNDTDANGETLAAVLVDGPTNGTLELNPDGSFEYTPDKDFNGTDSFTYMANDGLFDSNEATVAITINPVNDAPVAVTDSYSVDHDATLIKNAAEGVLANDVDAEDDPLTAILVDMPENGELAFNSDGSFQYTPDAGFFGFDTFTYRASDGLLQSELATVRIMVGDLTPGTITGVVYADVDNDGNVDASEGRFGGVTILLEGVDVLGDSVSLSTETGGDGRYTFDDVLPGNYTVTEVQPELTLDGLDTFEGVASLVNDRFTFELPAGATVGDYNFGEWGVLPQFISNMLFFDSYNENGILAAVGPDGGQLWYSFDPGWEGFVSAEITLSSNLATAVLSVVNEEGTQLTAVIPTAHNPHFQILGELDGYHVVRISGASFDFDLQPVNLVAEGEGEPASYARAVDALFAA